MSSIACDDRDVGTLRDAPTHLPPLEDVPTKAFALSWTALTASGTARATRQNDRERAFDAPLRQGNGGLN